MINNRHVAVAGGQPARGVPSFKSTLSAGDRNTLALAFFFASIDLDDDVATKIVVIDDPISSLDDHRSLTTAQQIKSLAQRTAQVIVLAHDKRFLCQIWEHANRQHCTPLRWPRSF
jgi:wobble nucleotide-excising tRNase